MLHLINSIYTTVKLTQRTILSIQVSRNNPSAKKAAESLVNYDIPPSSINITLGESVNHSITI